MEEIARLQELVKLLQYRKFAKKTEKSDDKQLELFDELDKGKDEEQSNNEAKEIKIKEHTRKTTNRKLPKHLPREKIYYDLKEEEKTCDCGFKLDKFGEDTLEQLEYIPAKLKIIEHIKSKYSCKKCYECVRTAKMPKQPIPKSIASPYIQADETTVNVLSEKEKNTNYRWFFKTGAKQNQIVIYKYDASRSSNVANEFLENFCGFLQTDGFSGYNQLKAKENITSIGCFAHCRRKFFELTKISKKTGVAHMAVNFIDKLYQIEREIKKLNLTYEEIYNYRQKKSKPLLDKFKTWLDKTASRVPPKLALSKAINYTLNQWKSLKNYCLCGMIDIDNNAVERMIKPFTIGRKNWLFQGNTEGAKASAILYSLVQTCILNEVESYAYFKKILTEIPNINLQDKKNLVKLLPINYEL